MSVQDKINTLESIKDSLEKNVSDLQENVKKLEAKERWLYNIIEERNITLTGIDAKIKTSIHKMSKAVIDCEEKENKLLEYQTSMDAIKKAMIEKESSLDRREDIVRKREQAVDIISSDLDKNMISFQISKDYLKKDINAFRNEKTANDRYHASNMLVLKNKSDDIAKKTKTLDARMVRLIGMDEDIKKRADRVSKQEASIAIAKAEIAKYKDKIKWDKRYE